MSQGPELYTFVSLNLNNLIRSPQERAEKNSLMLSVGKESGGGGPF